MRPLVACAVVFMALPAWAQEVGAPPQPVVAADPAAILGTPAGPPLEGPALDAASKSVSSLLRCPVCQGLSVADSPSTMAIKMRGQVRELVAAGYTEEQVLSYFERSYGEFVRLKPEFRGVNWLVWLAPLAALVAGALIIRGLLRSPSAPPPATPSTPEPTPDDPELAAYVDRVRQATRETR